MNRKIAVKNPAAETAGCKIYQTISRHSREGGNPEIVVIKTFSGFRVKPGMTIL
jgi:hypothetical protein